LDQIFTLLAKPVGKGRKKRRRIRGRPNPVRGPFRLMTLMLMRAKANPGVPGGSV